MELHFSWNLFSGSDSSFPCGRAGYTSQLDLPGQNPATPPCMGIVKDMNAATSQRSD
jgi:hypothetical protein